MIKCKKKKSWKKFVSVFNVVISIFSTGLKRKSRFFLSFQKASSTKTKKLVERKLTLWEYVFGPKRSSKDPCACQLADHQEQTCFQVIPGDVLNYTDSVKSSKNSSRLVDRNPLPKPPPSYKLPTAVLLRTTMESIAEVTSFERHEFVLNNFNRYTIDLYIKDIFYCQLLEG